MKKFLTNIWRKTRKAFGAFALFLGISAPAVVRAEGEPSFTVDTSAASSAVTELSSKITTFLTGDMMTAILSVVGAGLVIWLVFLCWKFIKRGGQKAG